MSFTLPSFPLIRALRTTTALTLALIVGYYLPQAPTFWLPLVAVLLSQTEFGFPLHQGLQRFFWILVTFLIVAQFRLWLVAPDFLSIFVMIAVTVTAYRYAYSSRRYRGLHFALLLMIMFLLTLLTPLSILRPAALTDIFLGAFIGFATTLLIFPDKSDSEFPKRVAPLLKDLAHYLNAIVNLLLRPDPAEQSLEQQIEQQVERSRNRVEVSWANKDDYFPVWVFEAGFNPALKAGQYYFVVHLGQITEILFAMQHFARHTFPQDLLTQFAQPLHDCNKHTQTLVNHILSLLQGKTPAFSKNDFIQDIEILEQDFRSTTQLSLELLDISRDYVYLAAFIRYFKDLRLQLLQLAATLSRQDDNQPPSC